MNQAGLCDDFIAYIPVYNGDVFTGHIHFHRQHRHCSRSTLTSRHFTGCRFLLSWDLLVKQNFMLFIIAKFSFFRSSFSLGKDILVLMKHGSESPLLSLTLPYIRMLLSASFKTEVLSLHLAWFWLKTKLQISALLVFSLFVVAGWSYKILKTCRFYWESAQKRHSCALFGIFFLRIPPLQYVPMA